MHAMSKPVFSGKFKKNKNIVNLSSAKLIQSMVKANCMFVATASGICMNQ